MTDSGHSIRVTICNKRGLHARAAAAFVKQAQAYDATIRVAHDGMEAPGDSIMELLMLAAAAGSAVDIHAQGPQAEPALAALKALVERGFDEDKAR